MNKILSVSNNYFMQEKGRFVVRFIMANLLLIVCSNVTVPNPLVPITLQTFGVCAVGLMLGPTAGFAAVTLWLGEAFIGLPTLANGASGPAAFVGPSAGYLFSFPIMALLTGRLRGQGFTVLFLGIFAVNVMCLIMGSLWLIVLFNTSFSQGLALGLYPFIGGALIKTAMLLCFVKIWLCEDVA